MSEIFIQQISQEAIQLHPENYNSNNHWLLQPEDYNTTLDQTITSKWIDFNPYYSVINIPTRHLRWLLDAQVICHQTRRFSSIFEDELESLLTTTKIGNIFDGTEYFVRSEFTSLKYGCHGVGPYTNLKSIIESVVTSTMSHNPIKKHKTSLKFYLLPWLKMDDLKEFRVFVYNSKITAISQQNLYRPNLILASLEDESRHNLIQNWSQIIVEFLKDRIIPHIQHIQNYTIDMVILNDDKPYFIELNPFGKLYSAGSALFHWILDDHILTSNGDKIYFRYSV